MITIIRHANWLGVKKVRMMRELRKTQTHYRVPGLYSGEFSFTACNMQHAKQQKRAIETLVQAKKKNK